MKRLITAVAALLIGTASYAGETINGKEIAMGAVGIPYVVGGTDQENWLVRQPQRLADKEILESNTWPCPQVVGGINTNVNVIVTGW